MLFNAIRVCSNTESNLLSGIPSDLPVFLLRTSFNLRVGDENSSSSFFITALVTVPKTGIPVQVDTISAAITAAETGVLLLSTLHTSSAANTINRIIDVFPANQQQQVKIQLAQILKGVVCQQRVPNVDGGMVPVFEIMKSTPAIQNMIREGKLHQLDSAMQSGASEGMCTTDVSLLKLYRQGIITKDTLLVSCVHYENMIKRVGMQ